MYVAVYLGLLQSGERQLADAFTLLADRYSRDPEIRDTTILLAKWSDAHLHKLEPLSARLGATESEHPAKLRAALLGGTRVGGLGLLWDLQDLELLISQVRSSWLVLQQAAKAMGDDELIALSKAACQDVERQYHWVRTQIKVLAPQAVVVTADPA
jgi:hypothetical protein